MSTLYNLLGIPPDADNETLKKAFREAVKATHPDIHADDPDARSRFGQIVAAYTLLRDAKQRATYDWLLQQRVRLKPCFAQEDQNASHETATILATIIVAVRALVAVIGAVASRKPGAVMKSAFAAMINAQRKYGGTLFPPVTNIANQQIDWTKSFTEAIGTPFATALTILFSIALGLALNLLLSRSDPSSALVPASKPAVQASTASLSAPLSPTTTTAAAPASAAPISAPPSPTAVAASDHNEIAGLLARGRAHLSDGDVALARVFLRRAAERNDPQAALALGGTYDPAALRRLGIPNFQAQADPAKAREWYRRAAELGSAAAALLLDQLSGTDR